MSFAAPFTLDVFAVGLLGVLLGYVIHQSRQLAASSRQLLTLQQDRANALVRADEARRAAEDARHFKDEFFAAASHELRTPLNAIVGWVHVLKMGILPDAQRQQAIEAIERNTRLQARLIEDLLDVSRMIHGRGRGSEAPAPEANRPSSLAGLRVLLAEDDVDSAAALKIILQRRGCEARTAHSAAECMQIINEWPAQVFLCDVGLPDDNGYNLLKRVRATPRGAQLPAIAVTALARDEDRTRALAAGFRAHVSKPFEVDLLLEEISSAVRA